MKPARAIALLAMLAMGAPIPKTAAATQPKMAAAAMTASKNGIVVLPSPTGTASFTVTAVNRGATGKIIADVSTGAYAGGDIDDIPLPVKITLCRLNAATGACLAPPQPRAAFSVNAGASVTVSVFVTALEPIPLDAIHNRVQVWFRNINKGIIGSASVAIQSATYQAPLTIAQGGVYSGDWRSLDPTKPAVLISTSDPVVIENCFISGESDLIATNVDNANVTVRNCRGYGLDPRVAGQIKGYFFRSYNAANIDIEHNFMMGTSYGVYNWGKFRSIPHVLVRYNMALDLDGVPSDGKGGRVVTGLKCGQDNCNHFVILDSMQGLPNAEVAWNQIITHPHEGVSIGDVINIYKSSGTPSHPILVHDNYMFGGYAATPTIAGAIGTPEADTAEGIAIDGGDDDTAQTTAAFIQIYNNQIVANAGAQGLGINVGHDNEAYGNRIVSTGRLENGQWVAATYSNALTVANCTCYNQPSSVYFNDFAHDNVVGWVIEVANPNNASLRIGPPIRSDLNLPGCAGGLNTPSSKCVNNVSLPNPITNATQDHETTLWLQKLRNNHIVLGPTS